MSDYKLPADLARQLVEMDRALKKAQREIALLQSRVTSLGG